MTGTTAIHKPFISLVDESFDEANLHQYHLSLELGHDSFSFAALDLSRNKYLLVERYVFQQVKSGAQLEQGIRQVLLQRALRWNTFKSQSIGVFSQKFTLVPNALFDLTLKETYLNFNSPVQEDEQVLAAPVKHFDTHCVFAVQRGIMNCLRDFFPQAKFMHTLNPLLDVLAPAFRNKSERQVLVHLQQGHFELIVLEEQKLLFANIFAYQSAEDFLYFLLFVFEQLKLNPEKIEVNLLGEIEKNSAIYSLLHKYVRRIQFGQRPEQFEYSYVFDGIARHFYYHLFSQALCV